VNAAYVAVVDDEAPVGSALRRLLRLAGYDVEAFDSGASLLATIDARQPACILLDVHMQGLTGFDVYARLNAAGWTIPAVFITASDDPDLDKAVRAAGGTTLLRKPFSNDALLAAVADALHS
jgi:FixJ family two-component response regulator